MRGIQRQRARRVILGEGVEAPVVHAGENLGRGGLDGRTVRPLDLHRPGLLLSGREPVAKRRETHLERLVVPRDEDRLCLRDQLVVSQHRQPDPEPAAVLLLDRDLDQGRRLAGDERAPLDRRPVADDLEVQPLAGQPRSRQQPRRASDGNRGLLRQEEQGQRDRRLRPGHDEIARNLELGAELVPGLVQQSIGAGRKAFDRDPGDALRVVRGFAARHLGAAFPRRQDLVRRVSGLPARAQGVSGGPIAARGLPVRIGRQLRRQERRLGLLQPDQAPGALARPRRAVEVGAEDRHLLFLAGPQEGARQLDSRLDRDESEPERPSRGPRLAALVRGVGREGVGIGRPLFPSRQPLVGLRRERDRESAVLVERGGPGRDRLGPNLRPGSAPPEPPGEARRPRDVPAHAARGHRKAEVVTRLAGEAGRTIEAKRLGRVLQRHLEGRPLVLLDAHHRSVALERRRDPPGAERPSGRNRELPRHGAEVVGRDGPGLDRLAVLVVERDGHRCRGESAETSLAGVARIREHLPEDLLQGPVDAPVGEHERRGRRALGRPRAPARRHPRRDGEIVAAARENEALGPSPLVGEFEPSAACSVGGRLGDPIGAGRIPAPLEDRDRDAPERSAGLSGQGEDLDAPTGVAARRGARRLHEDEVRYEKPRRDDGKAAARAEPRIARRRDEVVALRLHRRHDERPVVQEVGRRGKGKRPLRRGPLREQALDLLARRENAPQVPLGRDAARQVDCVSAEGQRRDVPVADENRPAVGAVGLHRLQLVARRLDPSDDGKAAPPSRRLRIRPASHPSRFARPNETIRAIALLEEFRELSVAHRVPGQVRHRRQAALEIAHDRRAIVLLRKCARQPPFALEASLEGRLALIPAGVPSLEIGQNGDEPRDGVIRGVVEPDSVGRRRIGAKKLRQVEREDRVRLGRSPARGIGQQGGEEVADGVAERVADPRRVVVGLDELRERLDLLAAQGLPLFPESDVGARCLVVDLLPRPRLEVHLPRRLDALAARHLPGVHLRVVHERLRVEELERGP